MCDALAAFGAAERSPTSHVAAAAIARPGDNVLDSPALIGAALGLSGVVH